jgi:hypothetical protein
MMAHIKLCKDENHRRQIADAEARLDAALSECAQLREENTRLRALVPAEPGADVMYEQATVGDWV